MTPIERGLLKISSDSFLSSLNTFSSTFSDWPFDALSLESKYPCVTRKDARPRTHFI
jgi:hypothetical protein